MKLKTLLTLFALTTLCARAGLIEWDFWHSVSDTNGPQDGMYLLTAIVTNAPDPKVQTVLTNQPNTVTNFVIDSSILPAPRCYVFVVFSNSTGISYSTPYCFDSAAFFAVPPQTNQPVPPPNPHHPPGH